METSRTFSWGLCCLQGVEGYVVVSKATPLHTVIRGALGTYWVEARDKPSNAQLSSLHKELPCRKCPQC